jgi:phosphate transport system substrate-binding protein
VQDPEGRLFRKVKAFTNFYLDPENAKLVMRIGYVPLPTLTLHSAQSRFKRTMTGSAFGETGSVTGVNQAGLQQRAR